MTIKERTTVQDRIAVNDTALNFAKSFQMMVEKYGEVLSKNLLSYLYAVYAHLTIANIVVFFFKYVSTTVFMYRHLRSYYVSSRSRLIRKQLEYEEIQLKTRLVTTKIRVRETEYAEWSDNLKKSLDRLRKVRGRVRELIGDNDELKHVFDRVPSNLNLDGQKEPEQDNEYMLELMKELKYEHTALSEIHSDKLDCGAHTTSPESTSPATSVYTSVSDGQKDCHIKIVKVTNVYKVSYLRNFIKQKRLKRASKQALLKKKMEDTKKLIEDWQRTLNTVINSKLAILEVDDSCLEIASQKAMGDYKPPHREYSDSDSELSWNHNSFRNYPYYEEPGMSGEYFAPREYPDIYQPSSAPCEEEGHPLDSKLPSKLFVIAEATSSQLAIEEAKSDDDDWDNQEIGAL